MCDHATVRRARVGRCARRRGGTRRLVAVRDARRAAGPSPTRHRLPARDAADAAARPLEDTRRGSRRRVRRDPVSAEDPPESVNEPVDLTGLTLQELQARAAQMQAEFIEASVAYESAALEAKAAEEAATTAEMEAAAAVTEADAAGDVMGQQIEELYSDGITANPLLSIITTSPDRTLDDMYVDAMTSDQILSNQSMTVETLDAERHRAEVLSAEATSLRLTADEAAAETKVLLDDIQVRAAKVASTANATLAAAAKEGRFADPEQAARNKAALAAWQRYLTTLDKAHVVPPPAKYLTGADLPYRLSPLKADRQPVAGVAAVQVPRPDRAGTARRDRRRRLRRVRPAGQAVRRGQRRPGDVRLLGPRPGPCGAPRAIASEKTRPRSTSRSGWCRSAAPRSATWCSSPTRLPGWSTSGINLGNGLMLAADATSSQVGVQEYPGTPYAVGRVTLPRKGNPCGTAPARETP